MAGVLPALGPVVSGTLLGPISYSAILTWENPGGSMALPLMMFPGMLSGMVSGPCNLGAKFTLTVLTNQSFNTLCLHF